MKISKLLTALEAAMNEYGDLTIDIEVEDSMRIKRVKTKLIQMSKSIKGFPNRKVISIDLK